jgi:drug/metabolite transporter (DMT)-like permease
MVASLEIHSRPTNLKTGAALAIAAAVLFGASVPVSKRLLGEGIQPQLLAGIYYLGSGLGLALLKLFTHLRERDRGGNPEAPLRRRDLPRLAAAVILGGMVAPALLMLGLKSTSASGASLLLNLEGVATMLLAWIVFHEHVDRWLVFGALAIVGGAVLLSWGGALKVDAGALLIAGACLCWGIDNNLTRALSGADPVQIALIKGVAAGGTNVAIALSQHARAPLWTLAAGAAVGFLAYGISLVLFVRALRFLGAARTSAYFSTAPFVGAIIAVPMFMEPVTARLLGAALLMAVGLYLHLRESHEHSHSHEELHHEHSHLHDEHHRHAHASTDSGVEPHSHWHQHPPLTHSHRHFPDLHHQHPH